MGVGAWSYRGESCFCCRSHLAEADGQERASACDAVARRTRVREKHVAEFKQGEATRAALLFLILTAARSGEVRGATWGEFDLDAHIWTVTAERMRAKEAHRVALSAPALALVKRLKDQQLHETLVFPSPRGKVLSDMVLTSFLRRVKAKSDTPGRVATAHGFRSSFRDWASENGHARDLAERALAHTVANKVEAAYHRTDLLEQHRPLMEAWAAHALPN
ncbi:tyrosine-type recombinase/integrase [Caballeronia grimmiae]|uniref:tyrosine-type recombinase/integrase n=2 Tax=Caballeronia grimmiae TaxID=1071679 RepID=UPI0038BDE14A